MGQAMMLNYYRAPYMARVMRFYVPHGESQWGEARMCFARGEV